jgi:hypothetical protein
MTAQGGHEPEAGTMDISEHLRTWNGFLTLTKWIAIGSGAVLIYLAVFRTHG